MATTPPAGAGITAIASGAGTATESAAGMATAELDALELPPPSPGGTDGAEGAGSRLAVRWRVGVEGDRTRPGVRQSVGSVEGRRASSSSSSGISPMSRR